MKLTEALKKWLVDAGLAVATASDDDYKEAASKAIVAGTLTSQKLVELTKDPDTERANSMETKLDAVLDAVTAQGKRIDAIETKPATKAPETKTAEEKAAEVKAAEVKAAEVKAAEAKAAEEKAAAKKAADEKAAKASPSQFDKMFSGSQGTESGDTVSIRFVGAHERYQKTSSERFFPTHTAKGTPHPYGGQRMFEGSVNGAKRYLDAPSECDQAVAGAYIKWCIRCEKGTDAGIPPAMRMTDHDRDLIQYALKEMPWGGVIKGAGSEDVGSIPIHNRKLTDPEIKAVLDDVTSGGIEIAPIAFDDMIIQIPILNGEFYPRVNTVNITRGRRIEGGSIGNVTLTSGGADGTAIPLFNTASFISAFDTTIHVVNGAIEIGLDFLSDSPIDVAGIVSAQYGQVLLAWLDEQCCIGDGTTEPEGILNASGTTSVNASAGAGGPPTVGDYEGLLFGVAKNYKQGYPSNRITYGATETTYARARGIAVGTADARRVFGMTHEDYTLFGHPYGINESFTNRQIIYCNWGRYRMYRRLGLTVKVTTEGKELVRNNLMLMTARARYGGQLEDGGAAAVMADAQS